MDIVFLTEIEPLPYSMILTISISVLAVLMLGGFVLYMWINQERSSGIAREVQRITNSIGAGVVNYIAEGEGHIVYASKGFYSMLGFQKNEVKQRFENNFYRMLESKYSEYLMTMQPGENGTINEEVEIYTKTGKKWVLLNGSYMAKKNSIRTISAVIVDITEEKELNEQLLIEQERYRIATELSNDVIMNYRIDKDTLQISENFVTYYGGKTYLENYMAAQRWKEVVHEDDVEQCSEMMRVLTIKGINVDQQLRLRDIDGKYVWCRIIAMPVKNAEGTGKELIGKLINIDMHKRELTRLESKAMRDPLTNAYNKAYTKSLIDKFIMENPDQTSILLLLDIDRFKTINDTYGHLMGDNVIVTVVNQITKAFRANDIIGRIGGDEFIVFVCNISNEEDQLKQARKLHEVLRQPAKFGDTVVPMSASIGVAIYPTHGRSYDELVVSADKALYEVKDSGRDSFKIAGVNVDTLQK